MIRTRVAARVVLIGIVGALALTFVIDLWPLRSDLGERLHVDAPAFGATLAAYLVGILAVTARRLAAAGRALTRGTVAGVGAAALWLAIIALVPPIPDSIVPAIALIVPAMAVAAYGIAGGRDRALAALLAALVAAPL